MYYTVHPVNPQLRSLDAVAAMLKKGGVAILPTDSVYSIATLLGEKKALERIYQIRKLPANKELSMYFRDFSQMSEFVKLDDNRIFRWMKEVLPGPYTIILDASKKVPQFTLTHQKTLGVRIIDHPVIQGLLARLDMPLIGTTLQTEDEYISDPEEFRAHYEKLVDAIVDAGSVPMELTTIADARVFPVEILREGKGGDY